MTEKTVSAKTKSIQTLTGHLLVFVQGLVLIPIVIKVAGPETYGSYALLTSYMSMIFGMSSLGIGINAKRWLPSTSSAPARAAIFYPQFWFQMLSVLFFGTISAIAYMTFFESLRWLSSDFLVWTVPVYLIAYALYSQISDYYRYTHSVGVFNISVVSQPYIFVIIVVGIYGTTKILTVNTLVISFTISSGIVAGLFFFLVYQEIGLLFCIPSRSDFLKEIKLGFPVLLAYLVDVVLLVGDRYVIATMLTLRDVGAYVSAYALGSLMMVLPKVFGVVLTPLISQRIDAGDETGAKRLSDKAVHIFLLLSIPYVAGTVVLGKNVLGLYTTSEVADASWPVVPIVALASIFYGLILLKSNILFVRLKTRNLFEINLVSMLVNIFLNIILIKIFGNLIVAAIATLVSYVFSYQILSRIPKKDPIDFRVDKVRVSNILLCSFVMGIVLFSLAGASPNQGIVSTVTGVMVGGITYAVLMLVDATNRAELAQLVKNIRLR